MISDTILVRIDTEELSATLEKRAEVNIENKSQILEKIILALQEEIEKEIKEFSRGEGHFEVCLYCAL